MICLSNSSIQTCSLATCNKIIPQLVKQDGVSTTFSYPLRFYERNEIRCCRAIAVYTLSLFGHAKDSQYVLDYQRDTDRMIVCDLDEMIAAALTGTKLNTFVKKRQSNTHVHGDGTCDVTSVHASAATDSQSYACIDMKHIRVETLQFTKHTTRYRIHLPRELAGTFYHAATCCMRTSEGYHVPECCYRQKQELRKSIPDHIAAVSL